MAEDDVRSYADERRRLLGELDLERKQLIRNIETCRVRDIDRPFLGQWSLKDIVGHVSTWESEVVSALRLLRLGHRPWILDFDQSTLSVWNEDHVERKRSLSFENVYEQLRRSRQRLLDEIGPLSDEELAGDGSVHLRLVHSLIEHDREHWHLIAADLAGMRGVREHRVASVPGDAANA